MNKKLILIVVAIVAIVGLIVFSLNYPPVSQSDVSGSFKKADKYREGNVENKDVILRTEFLNDTVKLKQAISDLVAFGDFSLQLKGIINDWWIPVLQKYNAGSGIGEAVEALNNYSEFIDNNTNVLQNTIITMADFYSGKNSEVNSDVEANLKQFYTYVSQFLIRDSVFEMTISKIDNSVKDDKLRKKEIQNLLALRDRIVVDNFIYAVAISDSTKMIFSMNQRINSVDNVVPLSIALPITNSFSAIVPKIILENSTPLVCNFSPEMYNIFFNTDNSFVNTGFTNFIFADIIPPAAFQKNIIGTNNDGFPIIVNKIDGALINQYGLGMFNQSGLGLFNQEGFNYGVINAAM